MTCPRSSTRRSWLFALLTFSSLSAVIGSPLSSWAKQEASGSSTSKLAPALGELLAKFRKCKGLSADYEEEKNIALLAVPLKSSGRVYFHPPSSLARITEKPKKSHLVIRGERIVVKEGNVRREVDLSDKPALRGLIGSLLHLLSGNEEKLLADYDTHFAEEGADSWRLELVPKSAEVRSMVESFRMKGDGLKLRELTIKETNGDETITRFSKVDTNRKFTEAEIARIFEI